LYVEFIFYSGVSREVSGSAIFCQFLANILSLPFFGDHFEFALFWQSFGNFCNSLWSLLATIWSFGHQKAYFLESFLWQFDIFCYFYVGLHFVQQTIDILFRKIDPKRPILWRVNHWRMNSYVIMWVDCWSNASMTEYGHINVAQANRITKWHN